MSSFTLFFSLNTIYIDTMGRDGLIIPCGPVGLFSRACHAYPRLMGHALSVHMWTALAGDIKFCIEQVKYRYIL